jgi:hypothetical protein
MQCDHSQPGDLDFSARFSHGGDGLLWSPDTRQPFHCSGILSGRLAWKQSSSSSAANQNFFLGNVLILGRHPWFIPRDMHPDGKRSEFPE